MDFFNFIVSLSSYYSLFESLQGIHVSFILKIERTSNKINKDRVTYTPINWYN